jgi:hypothetical protein
MPRGANGVGSSRGDKTGRRKQMAKYTFVVLTNAVEGKDDAFDDWYTNTHLGDVLAVPGSVGSAV